MNNYLLKQFSDLCRILKIAFRVCHILQVLDMFYCINLFTNVMLGQHSNNCNTTLAPIPVKNKIYLL